MILPEPKCARVYSSFEVNCNARQVGSGLNELAWVSADGEDCLLSRGEAEHVLRRACLTVSGLASL
jgi:hypothetical protein